MRVFIGIKLNDHTLENIDQFLIPFKKISSPIKWVKSKNIHLTLKFIGEVSEEMVTKIRDILSNNNFNMEPFELKLTGSGKFGRGKDLNIVWVGIDRNDKLELLFGQIEIALEKIGIKREIRPFKPHITVGRNKKPFNFKSILQLIEENTHSFISKFKVEHFQINKSELTQTGPIYSTLKEISLGTT